MSDSGLSLNLDFSSVPTKVKRVTGGRWKDRRNVEISSRKNLGIQRKKKNTEDRGHKSSINKDSASNSNESGQDRKRPASHPDTDYAKRRVKRINDGTRPFNRNPDFAKNQQKDKDTFVSSLFSSNPDTSIITKEEEKETIQYDASNAPLKDSTTFTGMDLNPKICEYLSSKLRINTPTKIQRAVIPRLLVRDQDLFVQAQTGSGKTLTFVLPIVNRLLEADNIDRTSGLFAIILTPTRELATQIYSVLESLTRCCNNIVPGIVIGGEKKKSEKARLRKGVNILVATPGRLGDHIEHTEVLDLSQVRWVVLDEGDKLMELGFEETITKILQALKDRSKIHSTTSKFNKLPKRQVKVLCSATMKSNVKQLGETSLENPELVSADSMSGGTISFDDETNISVPDQLIQKVVIVPPKLRFVTLSAVLKNIVSIKSEGTIRTMVFCSCSDSIDFHFSVFTKSGKKPKLISNENKDIGNNGSLTVLTAPTFGPGVVIHKLHGSLSQQDRTNTLASFVGSKKYEQPRHSIMFCTDVAARGLDLPHISTVIEYDPPFAVDDHLHRVGRTARAGQSGSSILFLLPGKEEGYLDYIKPYHTKGFYNTNYEDILIGAFGKKWDVDATTWHLNIERWILEDPHIKDMAFRAFTSHIRAYATHLSSERIYFNVKTLHLGHIAKSFALRETPKSLGRGYAADADGKPQKRVKEDNQRLLLRKAKKELDSRSSEFNLGHMYT